MNFNYIPTGNKLYTVRKVVHHGRTPPVVYEVMPVWFVTGAGSVYCVVDSPVGGRVLFVDATRTYLSEESARATAEAMNEIEAR